MQSAVAGFNTSTFDSGYSAPKRSSRRREFRGDRDAVMINRKMLAGATWKLEMMAAMRRSDTAAACRGLVETLESRVNRFGYSLMDFNRVDPADLLVSNNLVLHHME